MEEKRYVYVVGVAEATGYEVVDNDEPAAEEDPWHWTSTLRVIENFPKGIFLDYEKAVEYYEKLKKKDWGRGYYGNYSKAYICKIELDVGGSKTQDLLKTHHDERF